MELLRRYSKSSKVANKKKNLFSLDRFPAVLAGDVTETIARSRPGASDQEV